MALRELRELRCTCVQREKNKSFAIKTCAAAVGKNLVDLIEFNPVQANAVGQLQPTRKQIFILYFND